MKSNKNGYTYKVNNVKSGRQTIRFFEPDPIKDTRQDGTTVEELLRVCAEKLSFELERKGESDKLRNSIYFIKKAVNHLE